MGETRTTTDHDTIRAWAEERDGSPALVVGTGILRIDFPGYSGHRLRQISWEEFFDRFEQENLAFFYQDDLESGRMSRFFKFVERDRVG